MSKIDRNTNLTSFQIFTLVIIIGFALIDLMYQRTFTVSGADTWITCFFAAIFPIIHIIIITSLFKRFPNDTIFIFSKKILGNYVGTIINIIYIIYSIMFTVLILKTTLLIIYDLTFSKTPVIIMIILFLSAAIYISTKKAVVICRLAEVILIPLIFILIVDPLFHFKVNIDYILPIGSNGIENIFKAIFPYQNTFLGIYIIMLFNPYIKNKNTYMKSTLLGVGSITLIHILDIIIIYGLFGPNRPKMFFWPGLKYMTTATTEVFERVDLIVIMLLSLVYVLNIIFGFYFAKTGFVETLGLKRNKKNYLIIAIVFIITVYLTQSIKSYHLLVFNDILIFLSIGTNFILPLILLIFSILSKRRETA